jgi:uncharacterized membrane protein (UPF0127 family)
MKTKLIYLFVAVIALASIWTVIGNRLNNGNDRTPKREIAKIRIGGQVISVEIVRTKAARTQGLSGRTSLAPDRGMLFVFDRPDYYHFWMKEMYFPLDIIWLDENMAVVDLTANLTPSSYPSTVTSKRPARFILEVKAGYAEQIGLKIGDRLLIEK